jgi:hypothetical protein
VRDAACHYPAVICSAEDGYNGDISCALMRADWGVEGGSARRPRAVSVGSECRADMRIGSRRRRRDAAGGARCPDRGEMGRIVESEQGFGTRMKNAPLVAIVVAAVVNQQFVPVLNSP